MGRLRDGDKETRKWGDGNGFKALNLFGLGMITALII